MVLLTISIPAHNKYFLIEEAISSIMNEPEFSEEVDIVISDNSLNNDINLYEKKYAINRSIKIFDSKKFNCLDSNVNQAVNLALGEYVWIFIDDDLIVPGALKKIINFLKKKKPKLLILNSKSFKGNKIIEESRRPEGVKSFYKKNENDEFLTDLAGYLTYVGCVVLKRNYGLNIMIKKK